jgi:hypothetical protein
VIVLPSGSLMTAFLHGAGRVSDPLGHKPALAESSEMLLQVVDGEREQAAAGAGSVSDDVDRPCTR